MTVDDTLIELHISGKELEKDKGYNLRYILNSLKNFETLVDKTFLHFENKPRLTAKDKENLSVRLVEVREGSFVADLAIVMKDIVIPLAPLVAENSDFIWEMIKSAFTYLKTLLSAKEEGKAVNVEVTDTTDSFVVVHNGSGDMTINVNPILAELAPKLSPSFSNIAKNVDGDNVEQIRFSENNEDVSFTTEEANLFRKRQYLNESIIDLEGKVFNPNYSTFTGQIEILENDEGVPPGIYRFTTSPNLQTEDQWKDMFLSNRIFSCQTRVEINPAKGLEEIVAEIHLLEIHPE